MIKGEKYNWSEESSKAWKEDPAVYELYSGNELIYIGSSGNLKERFMGYLNSKFADDPCKKATDSYKREYVTTESEARSGERAYLQEYQKAHGQLPRCNDRIP